jgi:serine/threonine protein kinase
MSLTPGARLGPYEIVSAIGAGGMGEVYRAKDTKLSRDVAIKILPELFTSDADRLACFRREAQVLASLNHSNIAAIYGFEDSGATHALVMELVEGEDLSAHIARGPIPLAEALPIAKQIADALEAAHELGVVHRDLKPANIKVRSDGTAKVLDFGLAKAREPAAASDAAAALANSPTITSPALTERGVILGTAAYMSPEQAAGKTVDKRSDLWAFGVVLLEMLTGRRVFDGPDAAHVIAAVLKSEPNWTTLPAGTPAAVRRLLRRCLEKDRKRRLDSAADVRLEIEEALTAPSTVDGPVTPPGPASRSTSLSLLPWALVATLTIALAILGAFVWRGMSHERPLPVYASLNAPADYVIGEDDPIASLPTRTPMVFTPDGRSLIIQAARANKPQLFLQSLDHLDARRSRGPTTLACRLSRPTASGWASGRPMNLRRCRSRAALPRSFARWRRRMVRSVSRGVQATSLCLAIGQAASCEFGRAAARRSPRPRSPRPAVITSPRSFFPMAGASCFRMARPAMPAIRA